MSITAVATAEPDDFSHDPSAVSPDLAVTDTDPTGGDGESGVVSADLVPVGEVVDGELVDGEIVDEEFVDDPADEFERLVAQMQDLRVEYVDPQTLLDNPRNLRTATADVEDLKASMRVVGILCPLVVVQVAGDGESTQLMIVIGHRRKYAAIDLEFPLVPCVVANDASAAKLIVAQLAENGHRVGLSATEEAEGYHQLTLLDWTPEKIAKVRHVPVTKVKKSLTLRCLPEAARAAADTGDLTLDDAAVMAEFTDQPTVLGRILKQSGTWGFRHAVASEKSKAAYNTAKERIKAELILAGVKVTSKPKAWGYESKAVAASQLVDADGERLNVEAVRTRPGFAAFIEKTGDSGAHAVVYCVDPAEYGYSPRRAVYAPPGVSEEQRAAQERAEQEKAEHQEALKIAATVRTDFYRQSYSPTRVVKRLFPDVLRAIVLGIDLSRQDVDNLYADLGGVTDKALEAAKEDLLRRCLVAEWVCHQEHNLRHATGWPNYMDQDAAATWLNQLVTDGYTLSEAETKLLTDITPADVPDADDDAEAADEDSDAEPDDDDEPQPEPDAVTAEDSGELDDDTADFDDYGDEAMDDFDDDEPLE